MVVLCCKGWLFYIDLLLLYRVFIYFLAAYADFVLRLKSIVESILSHVVIRLDFTCSCAASLLQLTLVDCRSFVSIVAVDAAIMSFVFFHCHGWLLQFLFFVFKFDYIIPFSDVAMVDCCTLYYASLVLAFCLILLFCVLVCLFIVCCLLFVSC
jgi:hypothetical protein